MAEHASKLKTALIFGATGAVGKALIKDVLKNGNYVKVISLGRRTAELDESVPQDKLEQKVIDFEQLDASREAMRGVDDVYCCLGTTRAEAGGAEKFKRIDQEYVVNAAKIVAEENPSTANDKPSPVHFLYCSSSGASKNSLFLYPQSKGQTEERLSNIGFERVSIFRPGLLEITEPRTHSRPAESIFRSVFPTVNNALGLHMSISVKSVAEAMRIAASQSGSAHSESKSTKSESGTDVYFYTNRQMEEMINQKA